MPGMGERTRIPARSKYLNKELESNKTCDWSFIDRNNPECGIEINIRFRNLIARDQQSIMRISNIFILE
jgi:hypothetical protein